MGLDFNYCDAHWSYGGFHDFRVKVAESICINLNEMEFFGGSNSWKTVHDGVKPLLLHSDCDGHLTPKQCAKIYPRLESIVEKWVLEKYDQDIYGDYNIQQARHLIDGMKYCAENNKKLEFC